MNEVPAELAQQFDLAQPIGQGQTGRLLRAVRKSTGQPGVLKVLHPAVAASEGERLRIMSELKRQAAVGSVRIAAPTVWGDAGGTLWLFRPWVDGHSLDKILKAQGPLQGTVSKTIVTQVLQGLEALHRAGLLHLDVKPGHLICDRRGETVLIDAGIAAPVESRMRGAPSYLAPEVIAGGAASVRSDLYALGLIWLELVTGAQDLSALPEELEGGSVALMRALLSPNPSERPGSARQVLDALEGRAPRHRDRTAIGVGAVDMPSPTEPAPAQPMDDFSAAPDEATMQLDLADLIGEMEFEEQRTTARAPDEDEFEEQRTTAQGSSDREFEEQRTAAFDGDDAADFEEMRTQAMSLPDQTWEQAPTRLYEADDPNSARPAAMTTAPAPASTEVSASRPRHATAPEPEIGGLPAAAPTQPELSPDVDQVPAEPTPEQREAPPASMGVWFLMLLIVGAAGVFIYWTYDPARFEPLSWAAQLVETPSLERPVAPPAAPPAQPAASETPAPSPSSPPPSKPEVATEEPARAHETAPDEAKPDSLRPPRPAPVVQRQAPEPTIKPIESPDRAAFLEARDEARAAYGEGKWAEAEEAYARASELDPKNAGVLAGLGTSRLRQRDIEGAIEAFEQAVVVEPNSANFWAALGRAYLIDGQRESSQSAYRRALELDPANKYAREALGIQPID